MNNMQNRMVGLLGLVWVASGAIYAEAEYKPERYTVILDRSPFGSDPLIGAVSTPSTDEVDQKTAAALEQAYRLSFVLKTNSGEIRAGFQNLKPKKGEPLSSVVRIGESFMGMKLKSVDLANSAATLEYNGRPVTFELTKQASAVVKKSPTPSPRRFNGGFRSTTPKAQPAPPQPKLTPAEQQKRRDEIRKNLQDYQMEVIRKGMPPLPVPLTQEMDNQLVSEGVLPPTQ